MLVRASPAGAAMADADQQELGFLPKLVIGLGILLIAAAVVIAAVAIWYGMMLAVIERVWSSMFERSSGPLSFRFILQPVMSAVVAIHDSLQDARTGRSHDSARVIRESASDVARRVDCDRGSFFSGSGWTRLPVPGVQDVLSGSGGDRRPLACLCSVPLIRVRSRSSRGGGAAVYRAEHE